MYVSNIANDEKIDLFVYDILIMTQVDVFSTIIHFYHFQKSYLLLTSSHIFEKFVFFHFFHIATSKFLLIVFFQLDNFFSF